MPVGILELIKAEFAPSWGSRAYGFPVSKQYAGIMTQSVSVWRRNLGHEVFYATYYGNGDPGKLLPQDLDVLFVSTYTQASAPGHALSDSNDS